MFQFLIGLTFFKNLHFHLNLFMYSNYNTITQIEITVTVFTAIHFMTAVKKHVYVFSVSHMYINISYKIVGYLFYAQKFSTKYHLFLKDVKLYFNVYIYTKLYCTKFAPQLQPQNHISSNVTW
jgi:hypothetical protein